MKLLKALQLRKGAKGTRGVPDGSGPEGEGPTGRRLGNCPKKEDFDNEEDYLKAYKVWQQKKKINKALNLRKAKYTKRTGSPGSYKYFYGEEVDKEKKVEPEKKEKKGKLQGEEKLNAIRSIVKNKQRGKINGQAVDLTSASMIVLVADNLSEKNRKVYLNMPVAKMADVAFKLRERGAIK